MKQSNLSLAVFMALGVIACGGGGSDNNQTIPTDTSTPSTSEEITTTEDPTTDPTLVDPTQTHVVDEKNLLKETTVGALQYIRREGSEYDLINNPNQRASSTPLLGVALDVQNPKLTNIVLARQDLLRETGQPVRAQFSGGLSPEPLTREGRPQEHPSLQVENFENVDILAGAFKQFGSAAAHTDGTPINSYPTGDKFDYDTHVQDNVDKSGEHTRERVSHVYTMRYEYKQPFVDYPNALNPDDNRNRETSNPTGVTTYAPYPPGLPDIATLQNTLVNDAAWSTTDANDNSRHPVNIGTGGPGAFLVPIMNSERLFGAKTPAEVIRNPPIGAPGSYGNGYAWTDRWRNPGSWEMDRTIDNNPAPNPAPWRANPISDNEVNWTTAYSGTPAQEWYRSRDGFTPPIDPTVKLSYNYAQNWPNGTYPHYRDAATPHSYRSQYPAYVNLDSVSGYPDRHYLDFYLQNHNNTLNGSGPNDDQPWYHEHIFLEQEEFSAIRTLEGIRPLVNPIANEWDWTLRQRWTWIEHHQRWIPPVTDSNGNVIQPGYWSRWDVPRDATGTDAFYQSGVIGSCTGTCYGTSNITLQHAYWEAPSNQGGGVQGEFRGPEYWGWDDNLRTIRFNDRRIWDSTAVADGYKREYERKYGANLIWWSTQDSAFENWATSKGLNPRARRVDINTDNSSEDLLWAKTNDGSGNGNTDARDFDIEIQPTGDITNGLIRIGGHSSMPTLGEELKWDEASQTWKDHHNTKTRIFGRYHLAYADQDKGGIKQVSLNSYSGAQSFVARVSEMLATPYQQGAQTFYADLESKPERYSIGARPITLTKVQYGRVTSNLDLDSGEGPYNDGFLHSPFAFKNDSTAVDNYFYRGVEATTIEQMAALPSNGAVRYEGHALMYGIDNSYHGIKDIGQETGSNSVLPNAFALSGGKGTGDMTGYVNDSYNDSSLGFGNFVQARVDFGAKKVSGEVYNAWLLDQTKPTITKDLKVHFTGDIMGNTVIGTADRVYEAGDDKADFRAAFFGSGAEEMGGAFNSVTREQKYGSAYQQGDWGGVFGAQLVPNNTFQGDDGTNVYNGL